MTPGNESKDLFIIRKAIANNKATISSKDVDAYAKLLFKHFDANKNGRLEANEL